MKSWNYSCFIDSIFTHSFHTQIHCKLSFTSAFQTHRKCLLKRKNRAQGQKPVSIIMRRCSLLPNPFCLQGKVFSSKVKFWRESACAHINANDKGSAPKFFFPPPTVKSHWIHRQNLLQFIPAWKNGHVSELTDPEMGETKSVSESVAANLTDPSALLARVMFSACRFSLNDNTSGETKLEWECCTFASSFLTFCNHWKQIWVNKILRACSSGCAILKALLKEDNSPYA